MELTWTGTTAGSWFGDCNGFQIAQVLPSSGRWGAYVAHDPIPDRYHDSPEAAMAAVDRYVADRSDPTPTPRPKRRRYVDNTRPCETPG
jgi:hypothetical protein